MERETTFSNRWMDIANAKKKQKKNQEVNKQIQTPHMSVRTDKRYK